MKKVLFTLVVILALVAGGFYYRDIFFPEVESDTLRIVMSTEATDISPYSLNLNNATRTRNIYEGLVAFDRNLKIVPGLAVSWGNLSDTSWEFRLRKGVLFHDGSPFGPQDVVDAFKKAKASGNKQIVNYISTIKDISVAEGNRVVVTTYFPDPLLLSKLTKLFIHKDNNIGTGPYQFVEWIKGERFYIRIFSDYWGKKPAFQKALYEIITNRTERETGFVKDEIDILVGLTEEQALDLPDNQVINIYGLEVNFLMFRLDDSIFEDRNIREAIQTLIDPDRIEAIGNHFVRSSNQFIAPGVFGYSQNIPTYAYDPKNEARGLFGKRLERLSFDYLSTYSTLTQYLASQLRLSGFLVKENASAPDDLLAKISRNESQLFLMGWRAEDGDAGGFFDAFIHSDGPFNHGRYKNKEVDELIEKSRTEMNPQDRLSLLQEISDKINKDLIGIPLFETSRIYAIKEGIKWEPRLDGQVLATEVSR